MIRVIWPERISLKYWAACLVADYGNESLPVLQDEDTWQEWGGTVAGTGVFLRAGIPAPFAIKDGKKVESFKEWEKWAKVVYTVMADEYNIPVITTINEGQNA